jgi:hypothetical protein
MDREVVERILLIIPAEISPSIACKSILDLFPGRENTTAG